MAPPCLHDKWRQFAADLISGGSPRTGCNGRGLPVFTYAVGNETSQLEEGVEEKNDFSDNAWWWGEGARNNKDGKAWGDLLSGCQTPRREG